ncbi:MAG: OB-fold nucleic acid binding domain-containing protein, partial [Gammaproteobacteria bacterium]
MTPDSIAHILTGKRPIGSRVVVEGWVKSRRTSKGGFSFIALNDGSSIADLQAVADAKLDNYDDEVIQVNTGCALRVTGTVVESQGTGQAVEIQSERIEVVGWVDDPESYPIAKKRHTF